MADRYWVGGDGTWDATTTTNWATTSGGAGGASAPTSADNAYFDDNSNTLLLPFTVTLSGSPVCADLIIGDGSIVTALDGTMTLAGTAVVIDVHGSLFFPATNLTRTFTGGIGFRATSGSYTVTTNGISIAAALSGNSGIVFGTSSGGSTATWTLGSSLTSSVGSISIAAGTLDSGNFNITSANSLFLSTAQEKTLTLGSSTVTVGTFGFLSGGATTNSTLNAGTSTFIFSAASSTLNSGLTSGGLTFYNVSFTSAANGTTTINGANTFNDLNQTSRSATGHRIVTLGDNQTVSGTLTLGAANTAIRRIHIQSSVIGTQRTITLNGTLATLADVDFRDIGVAGTVSTPWTGTRLGNGLNNNNITFDAAKTVYWNLAGSASWTATGWATTNNGTPDVNNFPLAQDTATFTEAGSAGTVTIDANWYIGSIQMADGVSNRTTAFTLATGPNSPSIYGNVTLFSSLTLTGTAALFFRGQGTTQTITSAGITFTQPITVDSPSGTVQLLDNFTSSNTGTAAFTLTSGTLDLNEFNLSVAGRLTYNGTATRSIDFGSAGKIYLTYNGGAAFTVLNSPIVDNFTIAGTSHIELNGNNTAGSRAISVGGTSGVLANGANSPNIYISAGTDTVTAVTYIGNLIFTGFSGTFSNGGSNRRLYGNLVFSSTMTFSGGIAAFVFEKESGTQTITTNGIVVDSQLNIGDVNSPVLQLQDNLTMGSTRALFLTKGTLDLNDKVLTTGSVSTSNSNTRSIDFGTNGLINCEGAFTATTATGLTTAGRGRIKMTSASAKTFAGGGANYAGVALEQAGAGTLTITGANTFDDITNSNATASQITFPANTTTSVRKLSVSGSSGNLVSLRSSTEGTAFTIQTV